VGGRGDSGKREDGGAELRGWSVDLGLRVGFGWVRWDRGTVCFLESRSKSEVHGKRPWGV
jgi:hypothetical protein